MLSKLPQHVIAELFPTKESAPRKAVAELSPSSSSSARTKGNIIGYSDGESSEIEESSDDADESSTESEDYIDLTDIKPLKVTFLPATVKVYGVDLRSSSANLYVIKNMKTEMKLCLF